MMYLFRSSVVALLAMASWGSAQAASLYELATPTAALESSASRSFSFASGEGAANVKLQLQGYATLDGDNFWIDIASITLDGTLLLQGTWDLGGGGVDRILANPKGATIVKSVQAHTVDIDLGLPLQAGPHNLVVAYDSPTVFETTARAGFQGLGDEGWGINRLSVTGVSAVPEPTTPALWLAGLAVAGLWRRRPR